MLNDKLQNIDEIFHERLINHRAKPPVDAWDNINAGLNQITVTPKKPVVTYWMVGVSLLTIGLGVLFLRMNDQPDKTSISLKKSIVQLNPSEPINTTSTPTKITTVNTEFARAEKMNQPVADETKLATQVIVDETAGISPYPQQRDDVAVLNREENEDVTYVTQSNRTIRTLHLDRVAGYTPDYYASLSATGSIQYEEIITAGSLREHNKKSSRRYHNGRYIGVSGATLFSYRTTNEKEVLEEKNSERAEYAYSSYALGVNYECVIAKRLSLQSGLYYLRTGQVIGNIMKDKEFGDSNYLFVNSSMGQVTVNHPTHQLFLNVSIITSSPDSISEMEKVQGNIVQTFDHLEIPLYIKFKALSINNLFALNLIGGIGTTVLIDEKSFYVEDNQRFRIGSTRNVKKINFNGTIGVGFQFGLSERLTLDVEPVFKYFINSINQDDAIKTHPNVWGLFVGLKRQF